MRIVSNILFHSYGIGIIDVDTANKIPALIAYAVNVAHAAPYIPHIGIKRIFNVIFTIAAIPVAIGSHPVFL